MRLFILFLLLYANALHAQPIYKETEYGFGLGMSQYYGDLNQNQRLNYIRPSGSAFFKHNFNSYVALEICGSMGRLGGNDKLNKNTFEKLRNLSFESQFSELTANAEFNFLSYSLGDFDRRFTPYLNLGIGVFRYNPYAYIDNKKYFLKPLGTEGQNFEQYKERVYSNYSLCLPVGLGTKFWLSRGITLGTEINYRFTNTDYIDDVSTTYIGINNFPTPNPAPPYPIPAAQLQDRSAEFGGEALGIEGRQRGGSGSKDQFLTAQITLSFRLKEYRCPR
jgi:Domain of unknown function (DUF6089)